VDSQPSSDPVLARREQIRNWTVLGKRIGYGLLLVSCFGFFYGLTVDFESPSVLIVTVGLIGSCIVLPPAIVFAYGVRSAEKAERQVVTK